MISKIKDKMIDLKGKNLIFRCNGSRNQIEEFEGCIVECYNSVFVIKTNGLSRSFSYSDVLIGVLEVNI